MTNYEKHKRWKEKLGREAYLALRRRLYRKNPAPILARNKRWKDKLNPDVRRSLEREYQRKFLKKNGHNLIYRLRARGLREARKRNATIGDLTDIAKVYERARWWKQWFDVAVDHIIPLSRGGTHEAANLQIIYGFENNRKYNKPSYRPKVVFV
jgi:5-methylcytosine-specific restriction endonuclease McrA